MKRAIKWILLIAGGLVVLGLLAVFLVPRFVDLQKYKPQLEKRISAVAGVPVALRGDLSLSFFPWAGVAFTDLQVGNPPGYETPEMLSVKSFEVRVKLLPLLAKDIRVKRFVLNGARLVLERNKQGQGNWESVGKSGPPAAPAEQGAGEDSQSGGLPIKALAVKELAIKDSSLVWIDRTNEQRREITAFNLQLRDVSLDRAIELALSARLEGRPLSVKGSLGPLGKEPGQGTVPLDLRLVALQELSIKLAGELVDPAGNPRFDVQLDIAPFSPRKIVELPVRTKDAAALSRVAFQGRLQGGARNVTISDARLELDDSTVRLNGAVRDFGKPDVRFDLQVDAIDLDRYLPPAAEDEPSRTSQKEQSSADKKTLIDYRPLREAVLEGRVRAAKLKAHNIQMEDIDLKITGRNGVFQINPLQLKAFDGQMNAAAALDVRREQPQTDLTLKIEGVQAGPLLRELLKKDFLEGVMQADVKLRTTGDRPDMIKANLSGDGELVFNDGAVKGLDLPGMVRNAKAAFGLAEKGGQKPRTDFSELRSRFSITKGVVNNTETSVKSPVLRVKAGGKADLVQEKLDFRVEPKFVATLKGQGDIIERSGIMVPVLISGTFAKPKFRPDLEGIIKQGLGKDLPDTKALQKNLKETVEQERERLQKDLGKGLQELLPKKKAPAEGGGEKGSAAAAEETVKGLLEKLPFGKQ